MKAGIKMKVVLAKAGPTATRALDDVDMIGRYFLTFLIISLFVHISGHRLACLEICIYSYIYYSYNNIHINTVIKKNKADLLDDKNILFMGRRKRALQIKCLPHFNIFLNYKTVHLFELFINCVKNYKLRIIKYF